LASAVAGALHCFLTTSSTWLVLKQSLEDSHILKYSHFFIGKVQKQLGNLKHEKICSTKVSMNIYVKMTFEAAENDPSNERQG
jgi:hypothetical protein